MNTAFTPLTRALGIAVLACAGTACDESEHHPGPPVLISLEKEITVGSTVDPANGGDLNPYGLTLAQASAGPVTQGDLIVCNFNDGATNTQGQGTSVIGLSTTPGSTPYTIAQASTLRGCSAVVALADGNIVAAASQVNGLPLIVPMGVPGSPTAGTISSPYAADTFSEPWGLALAHTAAGDMLYVSNATAGTIDRINLGIGDAQTQFTEVITGFSFNSGVPGSILAPAGLTYDPANDTLYVVDSNTNRVIAFAHITLMGTDAVTVTPTGFTGTDATSARVIASGAPLNGPLSAALLFNGDLVVGNTLDPDGTNLLIEVSPTAGVIATRNVDFDQAGALFGIVATGTNESNTKIYFNDDNDATVKVLTH